MKTKKILSLVLSIVFIATMGIPVLAAGTIDPKASAQIAVYGMDVTPYTGELIVDFSITGSGKMEKIGCESIFVYKLIDGRWILTYSKAENDDGMSVTDAYFHLNTFEFDSERFEAYKVVITVFAKNAKGRDSRSETFFVTGQ